MLILQILPLLRWISLESWHKLGWKRSKLSRRSAGWRWWALPRWMYWEVYAQQMQEGGRGRPVVQCSPKPDKILVAMALYTLAQSNLAKWYRGMGSSVPNMHMILRICFNLLFQSKLGRPGSLQEMKVLPTANQHRDKPDHTTAEQWFYKRGKSVT